MTSSFHRNRKGKIKIIRKPCPVGNEKKNIADGTSHIVLNLGLYEGKDVMSQKDYGEPYSATAATTLQLIEPYHCSGCCVIADSWFSSVKTTVELLKCDLYSICWSKLPRDFPHLLLKESNLERGWVAYSTEKDGIVLQASHFQDLKVKDFISVYVQIQFQESPEPPNITG